MIEAYKHFWKKAFDFKGVSTRSQFWWSILITYVIDIVLLIITLIGFAINGYLGGFLLLILSLYSLGILVPSLSISIRRTNDAGKAWPWIFINLAPFGAIYYIILLCGPSLPIS